MAVEAETPAGSTDLLGEKVAGSPLYWYLQYGGSAVAAVVIALFVTYALRSTPAAMADRLIGTPCGPWPERGASTDTLRSSGTVCPAVTTVASATASHVPRRTVRRDGPPVAGASSTG